MRDGWREARLGDVAEIVTGATPPSSESDNWGREVPFLTPSDMTGADFAPTTARSLSLEAANRMKKRVLRKPGTAVVCIGATIGKVARVSRPTLTNQQINTVVPDQSVLDSLFSYYSIQTLGPLLLQIASGSATPILNKTRFSKVSITLPPIQEQQQIAAVLGALDDLIDSNQRLVATLDGYGRTLFDQTCRIGLEAAFMGEPPADWDLAAMGEVAATIECGKRPKGGVSGIRNGTPSLGAESIKGLAQFDVAKLKFVPTDFAQTMNRGVLESRDVLVYKDGGKPGDFRPHVALLGDGFPFDRMVINEHVYRVRASEPLSEPFLYFWLQSEMAMVFMRMAGTGAAIPGLNSTAFKSIPVAIPPCEILDELLPVLDALVGAALGCAKEAMDLRKTRDELLPLLMSGAISPGEAGVAA